MKLNQYQKQAIVRSIFQDVPVAKSEDIKAAVQTELVKAMSPACQRAYKVCPDALKRSSSYDLTYKRDPLTLIVGDADFSKVIQPWIDARRKYIDIKTTLTTTIEACITLKQLTDTLPEFAAYFPKEGEPTRNLPVVANLVADLVNLGWKPK
jgi:hypothetical protein